MLEYELRRHITCKLVCDLSGVGWPLKAAVSELLMSFVFARNWRAYKSVQALEDGCDTLCSE